MNDCGTILMPRFSPGVYEIRTLADAPVWAGLLKSEESIFGRVCGLPAGVYRAFREDPREVDSELWGELVNDGNGCVTKVEPERSD